MEAFLSRIRVAFVVLCWCAGRRGAFVVAAAPRHLPPSLENLAGEYTDSYEPDTPISFYVQNGKLTIESERIVPTELKQTSATHSAIPDTQDHGPLHDGRLGPAGERDDFR